MTVEILSRRGRETSISTLYVGKSSHRPLSEEGRDVYPVISVTIPVIMILVDSPTNWSKGTTL